MVSLTGMGLMYLWRGYVVRHYMGDDFDRERETSLLDGWFTVHAHLPPVQRIEIHPTCVLVVLDDHVVFLERTEDGLKQRPL